MRTHLLACLIFVLLTSCATTGRTHVADTRSNTIINDSLFPSDYPAPYTARMPAHYDTGGKRVVLVDPNVHAWGAYDNDGSLIRGGIATSGASICPADAVESDCKTTRGAHRIFSMGDDRCASKTYPRPSGGGLMPYCMYFSNGQALHGSPDDIVVDNNESHGCVRMRIPDAEWMRYNFAQVGTKVVVMPYD